MQQDASHGANSVNCKAHKVAAQTILHWTNLFIKTVMKDTYILLCIDKESGNLQHDSWAVDINGLHVNHELTSIIL